MRAHPLITRSTKIIEVPSRLIVKMNLDMEQDADDFDLEPDAVRIRFSLERQKPSPSLATLQVRVLRRLQLLITEEIQRLELGAPQPTEMA